MKQFEKDQMTADQIERLNDDKPFDYKWLTLDDYLKVILEVHKKRSVSKATCAFVHYMRLEEIIRHH